MKTSLYSQHAKLDSKIVDFAGFDMPVSYPAGINKESAAVNALIVNSPNDGAQSIII